MDQEPIHMVLDVQGLECPLPVIRAKQAMRQVDVGSVLEVWTTGPGSLTDFPAWTRATGHELLRSNTSEVPFKFWIRRTR